MSAREWIDALNAEAEAKGDPVKVAKVTIEVEYADGEWRRYTSLESPEDFKVWTYVEPGEIDFRGRHDMPPRTRYDLSAVGLRAMRIEGSGLNGA